MYHPGQPPNKTVEPMGYSGISAGRHRLLEQAGFRCVQIAGGFDGRPFGSDDDELVIEASRD
jgi:hypothetical protein